MSMKKEYDFSKAERGKFYRPGARLNLPVYLDPDVQARLTKAAQKRHEDVDSLVNRLLKRDEIAGFVALAKPLPTEDLDAEQGESIEPPAPKPVFGRRTHRIRRAL